MIAKLRNLGPTSAQWLAEVGINNYADLQRVGSVAAYAMVCRQQPKTSLNLLWAIEAAIRDIDCRKLTQDNKSSLRMQLQALTD